MITRNEVKIDENPCQCLTDLIKSASDAYMSLVEPYVDVAANQGWFIFDPFIAPYFVPLITKSLNPDRQFSPDQFVALLLRIMRRYYLTETNIESMRDEWLKNDWSRDRWPIFMEAIDCYKRRAYFACISTAAPLVEGIVTARNEMRPFSPTTKLKQRVREIDESGKLAQIVDNFFADTRSFDDFIEGSLNRHAILHGVDVKFGTQVKALQSIAILNALIQI